MKYLFPALCWLVPALGVFIACSKKPDPYKHTPKEWQEDYEGAKELVAAVKDLDEAILSLDAPTWAIFFEFDSYGLKEAHKAAAVAKYLITTGASVFLEGHASEEGATEYNLALGARRAVAVRNYLEAAGVPPDRMTWQSFGEERPVTQNPNLKHLNRRVVVNIERKAL